jgi:diguanylate cyclase (GGDEF)-like protein/PAS domain S-box-containing protein
VFRMRDKYKTKEQLIKDLTKLRQHISELERAGKERVKETRGESKEELRAIINCIQDGIVLLDLTGKITTINKRITETAGYTEKDVVGKRLKLLKMFPPQSITSMLKDFARVISGKQPPPYEVEVYTKKEERLFIEIQASLLREKGKKAGVVAVLRDITERKKLESQLLQERETFVTILQHAPYGVVLWEKDGKHVYVNPAFTVITGYTLEDIPTGRDWMHKAYPDEAYREKVRELWKDDKRLGLTTRVISVVCKNGETKEIEFRTTILEDGRAVVMLADITERQRAEEELQRYREHLEELVGERTAALQETNAQLQREIAERKRMEEALRESEEYYRILIDNIRFGINLIDTDHTIMMVNAAQEKYYKKPRAQLVGKKCYQEFEKRDAVCLHCPAVRAIATKKPAEVETVLTADDGSHFHVRIQAFPIFGKDGTVTSFIEIAEIITERKQMEEALRESEERFRLLVEHSKDTFLLHDLEGSIIDVNQHACESLGYTREELLHLNMQDIDQDFVSTKYLRKWKQMVSGEPITVEGVHRRKDGTTFPVEVRLGLLESGGRRLILGLVRDITERVRAEETIRKLAYHDALTGLPNRVLFANRLNRAMAHAHHNQSTFAVMSLDLDYFKNINDTLGHSVGDQLLQHVGKRLAGLLRKNDTVSRTGGDEFFLLLPEIALAHDAATIAQKVLKAVQEPFTLDAHEVTITTSIGVAMYPDNGKVAESLLKHADIALYQAKQKGRNNYQRYTASMDA